MLTAAALGSRLWLGDTAPTPQLPQATAGAAPALQQHTQPQPKSAMTAPAATSASTAVQVDRSNSFPPPPAILDVSKLVQLAISRPEGPALIDALKALALCREAKNMVDVFQNALLGAPDLESRQHVAEYHANVEQQYRRCQSLSAHELAQGPMLVGHALRQQVPGIGANLARHVEPEDLSGEERELARRALRQDLGACEISALDTLVNWQPSLALSATESQSYRLLRSQWPAPWENRRVTVRTVDGQTMNGDEFLKRRMAELAPPSEALSATQRSEAQAAAASLAARCQRAIQASQKRPG